MVVNNQKQLNIWYCHPYACAPSTGHNIPNRPYFLAKAWTELGHNVQIIACSFEHIAGLKSFQNEKCQLEKIEGVDFIWLKTPTYQGAGLNRIKSMLVYARLLKKYAAYMSQQVGQPDIIICSSPDPFHFNVCLALGRQFKSKLISEIRDLWPLSLIEILGLSKYHPLCLYLAHIERKMCQYSDAVVGLSQYADRHLQTVGLAQHKFHWVPNGFSLPKIVTTSALSADDTYQKLKTKQAQGKFIIGYTGAIGIPNHLDILCNAVTKLVNDNVELFIIGEGNHKQYLSERYKNSKNIYFISHKPKSMIVAYQKSFDLGYIAWKDISLYNYGLSPNKMYEYMHGALPILCPKSPTNTVVHKTSCGVFFENDAVDSLEQAILLAKHQAKASLLAMGERGKAEIEKNYFYSTLAKKYLEIISNLFREA